MHNKNFLDKNICMENKEINIINITNQSIKTILMTIDNFINDIKNEKLKNLLAENINKFDTLVDECKILAKSYNEELEDLNFFEKYQNLISLKISSLTKKNTYEIAEIIYLSITETMPKLYSLLSNTNLDETELAKKLITQNENLIDNLKQFFIVED